MTIGQRYQSKLRAATTLATERWTVGGRKKEINKPKPVSLAKMGDRIVEDLLTEGVEQGVRQHVAHLFANYVSRAAPANKVENITTGINDTIKAYEEVSEIISRCSRENT